MRKGASIRSQVVKRVRQAGQRGRRGGPGICGCEWRNVGKRVHCVGASFDSQRKGNPYRYVFLDTASTLRGRAIE